MKTVHCVVTGGAGFIGSHLTEALLDQGHGVTVIDNFSTGRLENIAHLKHNSRLTLVKKDITGPVTGITGYFKAVDWVFHLAALADIVPSIVHPLAYAKANIDGTLHVLEASRLAGVKRFVYAASSSCYGIATQLPTTEIAPIDTKYPYALTKYVGECAVLHWGRVYKFPVVSLRLFNVYGPRSRTGGTYGAVFGTFLAQKLAGKPYTVVGDGSQTRDFVYVSDVVQAFIATAQSDVYDDIFNVGSNGTYSINTLVSFLGGPVVNIPKRPGEPDCTWADISKIKTMLHWKPVVAFEDGVQMILKHLEYWKDAPVWTPASIRRATKGWFTYL
jgi:UDP-glucose 4-epimerase